MRKKLKGEGGLSLVELLCAVVILILLGLLLNTGLQMAVSTCRSIVARSELELLLSTAVDALADELRCARDVSGSGTGFTYTSGSFGADTSLAVEEGQIMAKGRRLLSTGVYGAYRVAELTVTSGGGEEVTFRIELTVETEDGRIRAQTPDGGVSVRCLNPGKDTNGGGP